METPAPSGKGQVRAKYIRGEMEKLGLAEIRDDRSNVSGVRKLTGGGPAVVFAAHMDTVFPEGTELKLKREGDILRAPGIGDDTSNSDGRSKNVARAQSRRRADQGGLIFLASVQEEIGLQGAKHCLETSGYKDCWLRSGHTAAMTMLTVLPLLFSQAVIDRAAPLFDAIRQGDLGQVRALMTADPTLAGARNSDGATPALWAAYTRHPDLAAVVLAGREPDFFEACALGNGDRASALLGRDHGLVDAYSGDGFTALGLAVFFGHEEIARQLVAAGADVNRPSKNAIRVSPLHSAVESGSLPLLNLLLEHGANPDAVEFLQATPLHSAAARGSKEMVERLLKAGADSRHKTKDGKTAADLARQYGHEDLAMWIAPR